MEGPVLPQKIWFLRQVNIFKGIPDADYAVIDRHSAERRFAPGAIIYRAGSLATSVYMLKRGKVKLSGSTEEGKEVIFAILKEGDLFGDLAIADQREHEEEATALTDVYLCVMRREDFEALLNSKPYLSLRFVKWSGVRRRVLEHRLQDLLFRSVPSRLARLVLSLAKDFGEPRPDRVLVVPFHLSHQEMASLTGASRETVSALLSDWKKRGLIDYSRKHIALVNPGALQSHAAEP
jgi:CRP-like cAMP-binding protein